MTDIVERLRSYLKSELDTSDDAARERDNMIEEAADEIERLRAGEDDFFEAADEIERLRADRAQLVLMTELLRTANQEIERLRAALIEAAEMVDDKA
jgi:hypothetical protein